MNMDVFRLTNFLLTNHFYIFIFDPRHKMLVPLLYKEGWSFSHFVRLICMMFMCLQLLGGGQMTNQILFNGYNINSGEVLKYDTYKASINIYFHVRYIFFVIRPLH